METRKVQVVGGTTYVVSLPKKWVREVGLGPNEELIIVPKGAASLLIMPKKELRGKSAVDIEVDSKSPEEILKLVIACYLAGHQNMRVKSKNHIETEFKSFIKSNSWKFMGFEITVDSQKEIGLTTLFDSTALSIPNGLRGMLRLISSMHEDSMKAFFNADRNLAEDVTKRDNDVDRLNLFIIRQLTQAEGNLMTSDVGIDRLEEVLHYRSVVKDLERIGDYATSIAGKASSEIKLSRAIRQELNNLSELAKETYSYALESFLNNDIEFVRKVPKSDEAFRKKRGEILRASASLNTKTAIILTQVVDRLSEMMAKSKSITNETFNKYMISMTVH